MSRVTGFVQHCSEKLLHRYLTEFDFRHNHRVALGYNDGERAALAMKAIGGKRLTYRPTKAKSHKAARKLLKKWRKKNRKRPRRMRRGLTLCDTGGRGSPFPKGGENVQSGHLPGDRGTPRSANHL